MSIQNKITKLEKQFNAKFPPKKPSSDKVMRLWFRAIDNEIKTKIMKDYKDKHYKLWVFTDDQKVTQADFDQFKYDHLKHMSQFGGNYKEEAEKWFIEIKDIIDRVNGWIK